MRVFWNGWSRIRILQRRSERASDWGEYNHNFMEHDLRGVRAYERCTLGYDHGNTQDLEHCIKHRNLRRFPTSVSLALRG